MTKVSMMQLALPKVAQPKLEPFGLKSAMEHWPSGTDARQSAKESAKYYAI